MLESEIESHLVKYAEDHGCIAAKLSLEVGRGWPDRTIITPRGVVGFVELKRPKGRISKHQQRVKGSLTFRNVPYAVVFSKLAGEAFVNLLLRMRVTELEL